MSDFRDQFPITAVHRDGTETKISLEEYESSLTLVILTWRKSQDPAVGIEALLSCLLAHRPIPGDLQDWLFHGLNRSRNSKGVITIDEALKVRKGERDTNNAYTARNIATDRSNCTYLMALLQYVTGNTNKSLRARLAFAREKPPFSADTLARYYRNDCQNIEIDVAFIQDTKTKVEFLSSFLCDSLTTKDRNFVKQSIKRACQI